MLSDKARKFRYDPCKLSGPSDKLFFKGYPFDTVVKSLNGFFFGFNINFVFENLKRD